MYWSTLRYNHEEVEAAKYYGNRKNHFAVTKQQLATKCKIKKDMRDKTKQALRFWHNLNQRSPVGQTWNSLPLERFPPRVDKGAVPAALIQRILQWSKKNRKKLVSKSFSGEDCKNDDSQDYGPGDKHLAIIKINDPAFKNSPVDDLQALVMSKFRHIIEENAFPGETQATLEAYDSLEEQKKLPLCCPHLVQESKWSRIRDSPG